jgi:hypothetical protein
VNRIELQQVLDNERFDPRAYSLSGGLANDTLCISEENGMWCYYYTERGERFGLQWFSSEEAACSHLLSVLRSLPEDETRVRVHVPKT